MTIGAACLGAAIALATAVASPAPVPAGAAAPAGQTTATAGQATPPPAAPPDLTLAESPGAAAARTVTIDLPPAEAAQTRTLFLAQNGGARLQLRLGVSLPRATVTLTAAPTATASAGDAITLDPPPAMVPLTLAVSNVPGDVAAPTELLGSIYAVTDDSRVLPVAALQVRRPPTPSVTVSDAGESAAITRQAPSSAWRDTITLAATTAPPITGITVVPTALVNENNTSVPLGLQLNGQPYVGQPFDIADKATTATIALSADLVDSGTYHGTITVRQASSTQVVRLEVDRTRVAPAIVVDPILAAKTEVGPGADAAFDIPVDVRETGGRTTKLTASVVGLGRKSGTTYDLVGGGVSATVGPSRDVAIEPNQMATLTVALHKLPGPGAYKGTLRLSGRDGPPVDTSFEVFVRNGWLLAAALILVGIVLSELVRLYRVVLKPKLVQRSRASAAAAEIERLTSAAPVGGAEREVAAALQLRLRALIEGATSADVAAGLDEVADKLPRLARWVSQWQHVREAGMPPDVVLRLDAVGQALVAHGSWDATGRKTADDALAAVDQALSGETEVRRQLAELRADVEEWRRAGGQGEPAGAAPAGGGDDPAQAVLATADQALDKLDEGKPAEAATLLRRAQGMWAQLLAGELTALAGQGPPTGVPAEEWVAVTAKLRVDAEGVRLAPPDEAAELYRAAYAPVVDVMIRGLRAAVESLIQAPLDDPDTTAVRPALFDLRADLAEATLPADVDGRRRRYADAAQRYADIAVPVTKAGLRMGSAGEGVAGAPPLVGAIDIPAGAGRSVVPPPAPLPSARSLRWQILAGEAFTLAVVIAAAVATGVLLLWSPNDTWGSPNDWFIAVLWGLGLHQVGGAAQGVPDVRKALFGNDG